MKKLTGMKIIFFLIMVFSVFPVYAQEPAAIDLIYLTESYPPHNYLENGRLTGVSIEILQLMWKKLGLSNTAADVKMLPWARGMARIQKEKNIVLFGMGYSAERSETLNWVGPYYAHSLFLIGKKEGKFSIHNLDDAKAFKVGVVREDVGHQILVKKGFPLSSLDLTNNADSLYRKLKAGRIDMICFMEDSAFKAMPKSGLNPDNYERLFEIFQLKSGFGFSKQVPKSVITDFQGALDAVIQDGSVASILKKYKLK